MNDLEGLLQDDVKIKDDSSFDKVSTLQANATQKVICGISFSVIGIAVSWTTGHSIRSICGNKRITQSAQSFFQFVYSCLILIIIQFVPFPRILIT
eukprot:UN05605